MVRHTSGRPDHSLAVVVGAGALGMAVARRLAIGHRVLLADIDGKAAVERAEQMVAQGCDAAAIACDVTDRASVHDLARAVGERGGFQALVQVAGLSPSMGSFVEILRVNLMGAARVCEALLPLADQGSAALLISSVGAHHVQPPPAVKQILSDASAEDMPQRLGAALGEQASAAAAYSHSKWGLNHYARRNAVPWGERGARILSLSPGLIATPMGAREFAHSSAKMAMYEKIPLKRNRCFQSTAVQGMRSPTPLAG